MLFYAKIHNHSLGSCFQIKDEETGIKIIKSAAENYLERELTKEENERIENDLEFIEDSDPDNIYTWTLGIAE